MFLNDISDHVELVNMIYTSGNVNHSVRFTGCWIYGYNYNRAPSLIKTFLNIIFIHLNMRRGFMLNIKMFNMPLGTLIQRGNLKIMNR